MILLLGAAGIGLAVVDKRDSTTVGLARGQARWPESICTPTSGPSFQTTTMSDDGEIRIEPPTAPPVSRAEDAYLAYLAATTGPSRQQAPQLQVRYGLMTDGTQSVLKLSLGGAVPLVRRVPVWVISICNAPFPPHKDSPGVPPHGLAGGQLIVGIDPIGRHPVAGSYRTEKVTIGQAQYGIAQPSPSETPYRSVRWALWASADGGRRLLLTYQTEPCMALDHVETSGPFGPTGIQVVLSGPAPGEACPADSAIAPFAEAVLQQPMLDIPPHGPRGSEHFVSVHA